MNGDRLVLFNRFFCFCRNARILIDDLTDSLAKQNTF